MLLRRRVNATITLLASCPAVLFGLPQEPNRPDPVVAEASSTSSARHVAEGITEPGLRALVDEVLVRNPGIAGGEAKARAAGLRAPQVKALPDPVISLTGFLETPETRTGPQRFSAGVFQSFPWFGKLDLKEKAALYEAVALAYEVDAKRLQLVTESRRLFYEIEFLHRYREIAEEYLGHLSQHEEVSRARYATGVGLGQGVVKIQAEITKVEDEILAIEARLVDLQAQLNTLRDLPASTPLPREGLTDAPEMRPTEATLFETALRNRPELVADDARISRAESLIRLAKKENGVNFKLGLTYTAVEPRKDAPGRLNPPEGNGDDILGIQGAFSVPVWRNRISSGVEEAIQLELAARKSREDTIASIRGAVGDLEQRVPLIWRQLRLVEDLLIVQAEEALESARAGYVAGTLNALDLLDAEHVLFEAHISAARAKTDYLVGLVRLEGAVGSPLQELTSVEQSES